MRNTTKFFAVIASSLLVTAGFASIATATHSKKPANAPEAMSDSMPNALPKPMIKQMPGAHGHSHGKGHGHSHGNGAPQNDGQASVNDTKKLPNTPLATSKPDAHGHSHGAAAARDQGDRNAMPAPRSMARKHGHSHGTGSATGLSKRNAVSQPPSMPMKRGHGHSHSRSDSHADGAAGSAQGKKIARVPAKAHDHEHGSMVGGEDAIVDAADSDDYDEGFVSDHHHNSASVILPRIDQPSDRLVKNSAYYVRTDHHGRKKYCNHRHCNHWHKGHDRHGHHIRVCKRWHYTECRWVQPHHHH